jgi:hypothetical protein
MPDYRLLLHDGPSRPVIDEPIKAQSDAEAMELAGMRLLLTPDYTHIAVLRDEVEIGRMTRDSIVRNRDR